MGEANPVEVGQLLVSVVGLLIIWLQIRHLLKSIHGTTQDNVYAHYTDVCKLLMERPHLRSYFYNGKELTADDKKELRDEVEFMSELILGLIEHAVVQEENLPGDAWRHCWWPYARERLVKGTEMRKLFDANACWYTAAMREVVRMIDAKEEPKPRGMKALAEVCKTGAAGRVTHSQSG